MEEAREENRNNIDFKREMIITGITYSPVDTYSILIETRTSLIQFFSNLQLIDSIILFQDLIYQDKNFVKTC